MSVSRRMVVLSFSSLAAAPALIRSARAESIEDFYRGKTIRVIVPTGPGGTYALYGNLINEYVSKHIPGNPNLILQFIPSGITAMNTLYNVSSKDGLTIAMIAQSGAMTQVLTPEHVKYDMRKMPALGLFAQLNGALTFSDKTSVTTPDDLKKQEVTVGATDTSSYQYIIPQLMNRYLGTKLKVITGYKDIAETTLAMERGEVDGVFTSWLAIKQQRGKKAIQGEGGRVIVQVGYKKEPDLDVALLSDLAPDDRARQAFNFIASFSALSRGLVAPPGVPEDRLAALRAAVAATIADPAFIAALEQKNLPFRPLTWQEQQEIMDQTVSTPRDWVV